MTTTKTEKELVTMATALGGTVEARREEMTLFTFGSARGAVTFATLSGGMLIRGLVRGSVDVAVLPAGA